MDDQTFIQSGIITIDKMESYIPIPQKIQQKQAISGKIEIFTFVSTTPSRHTKV